MREEGRQEEETAAVLGVSRAEEAAVVCMGEEDEDGDEGEQGADGKDGVEGEGEGFGVLCCPDVARRRAGDCSTACVRLVGWSGSEEATAVGASEPPSPRVRARLRTRASKVREPSATPE